MSLSDASAVMKLNESVVTVTSPMDTERFAHLFDLCAVRLVAETDSGIQGFVMAVCDGRPYDNANYQWFSERLTRFMYVDRVVVSEQSRGSGIRQQFYSSVAKAAVNEGAHYVCAEIDTQPPNPQSLRFHVKNGFVQIGERVLESRENGVDADSSGGP